MAAPSAGSFFDRLPCDELVSVCIISRLHGQPSATATALVDRNVNSVTAYDIVTWMYPSVDDRLQKVLLARSPFLALSKETGTLFSFFEGLWHYSAASRVSDGVSSARGVVVVSKVFCPPKFLALATALLPCAGEPPRLLEAWLLACIRGAIPAVVTSNDGGVAPLAWPGRSWDITASAYSARGGAAGLRSLLAAVGVESILLWTALMLRRRVAVAGRDPAALAAAVCSLPHLVAHRLRSVVDASGATRAGAPEAAVAVDMGVPLYPLIVLRGTSEAGAHAHSRAVFDEGCEIQLAELIGSCVGGNSVVGDVSGGDVNIAAAGTGQPHYIAGFLCGADAVASARGLWDVLLDLETGAVTVADAAAAEFAMTPLHKGVAKAMLAALDADGASDESVAAAIGTKTEALLEQARAALAAASAAAAAANASTTGGSDQGSEEASERLRELGLPEASQRFLRAIVRADAECAARVLL